MFLKPLRGATGDGSMKVTVSLIKADIGGWVGHSTVHPKLIEFAQKKLQQAKETGLLIDYYVFNVGDDLQLLMTHTKGDNNPEIHKLAWDTFVEATEKVSKPLKLYGAGQDLLKDTFSGNVRGMGPQVAEMTFEERRSEPIIVFAADKTEPGAWNLPLYKIFADPFNTGRPRDRPQHARRLHVRSVRRDRAQVRAPQRARRPLRPPSAHRHARQVRG
jgi:fructose 1,6-bisphosphate aldolase/phosphatase